MESADAMQASAVGHEAHGRDSPTLSLTTPSYYPAAASDEVPERPPVSPITPTEDSPPGWPGDLASHVTYQASVPDDSKDTKCTEQLLTASQPSSHAHDSAMNGHGELQQSHTMAALPSSVAASSAPRASFMQRPPTEAIDESSNPDVAALKACISVLQLQRQKSQRDIIALQGMKDAAVADPAGFTTALQAGKLNDRRPTTNPLSASFEPSESDDEADADGASNTQNATADHSQRKFGSVPQAQSVVRCPPINWSKYHVVGESLDRMHEEQRRRPDPGEPWRESHRESVVIAPFSPFKDKDQPLHTHGQAPSKRGGKRLSS